jgi:hypothetical protein
VPDVRWLLIGVLAAVTGCSQAPREPSSAADAEPSKRIFHIRNTHYVSRDDYAADMRSQLKDPVADETINGWYDTFLDDLESLQVEQVTMLQDLIREHDVRAVFLEGVTDENLEAFRAKVQELKSTDPVDMERRLANSKDEVAAALNQLRLNDRREDLLQVGAVGRLMMYGELQDVLPLDDTRLMEAANPVGADSSVIFDETANAAREGEMVRRLLSDGPVVVFVLGGDHDLRDEIKAECPGCAITVLTPEKFDSMNARE